MRSNEAVPRWCPELEGGAVHAAMGDRLVVPSHRVGQPDRSGVIIGVRGAEGSPPYRVVWDDGHEALFFPGSDVVVEHLPAVVHPT